MGLDSDTAIKAKERNYHGAIDVWLTRHKPGTVLCFVQFKSAEFDEMPRVYLAAPSEVAMRLRAASGGRGDTTLFENYIRGPRASGAGTLEKIPNEWKLSRSRIQEILDKIIHTG